MVGSGSDGITVVNGTLYDTLMQKMHSINTKNHYLKEIKSRSESCNSDHCPFYKKGVRSIFIYKRGKEKAERMKAKSFDVIIPRIAGTNFEQGCVIVKQLSENMGIFSTSSERGLKICSNKYLTAQVLSKAKIRNPKQIIAHQPSDYKELIDLAGGLPCVAKLQRGSLGNGIMLLESFLAASTSLRSFQSLGVDVILQQYIESGNPKSEIRVLVIGPNTKNVKTFAYKRYSLDSDFRSNYTISGLGEKIELTQECRQIAINAALAVGLGISGVDVMLDINDNDKPYVIEVNGSPGLKGIETITGENIAREIVLYAKRNFKKNTGFKNTSAATPEKKTIASSASVPTTIKKVTANIKTIFKKTKKIIKPKSYISFSDEDIGNLTEEEYNQLDERQRYLYDVKNLYSDLNI
jgi:ribosomal protein S6--L-glutamate ligase